MNHLSAIKARSKRFSALCKRHKVKKLYVFGSSITKDFQDAFSDIDLLVEIDEPDPVERGDLLLELWDELEIFFSAKG